MNNLSKLRLTHGGDGEQLTSWKKESLGHYFKTNFFTQSLTDTKHCGLGKGLVKSKDAILSHLQVKKVLGFGVKNPADA